MSGGVGDFCTKEERAHRPASTHTHDDRSLFRLGDALLETAIAVTCVRVGHARNEQEHDQAFAELEILRSQRESRGVVPRADVRAQIRASIDNQIQDLLHEQMDAERSSGGQTLDEFLAGSQ